jgi:hypothetical protein
MTTPNFGQLYAQLDLQPGCTLEELRHAYRQRMRQLHPDKQAEPEPHSGGESAVSDLNSIYASAIRFHKEHGRLPGGRSPVVRDDTIEKQSSEPARRKPVLPAATTESLQDQGPTLRRGPMLLILLLLTTLALAIFLDSASETAPEPAALFKPAK